LSDEGRRMSIVLSMRIVTSKESTVWRRAMSTEGLVNLRVESLLLARTALKLIPSGRHNLVDEIWPSTNKRDGWRG